MMENTRGKREKYPRVEKYVCVDDLSTMCFCTAPQEGHDPPAVPSLSYLSPHAGVSYFIINNNINSHGP